jgi:hypothetical protein
MKSEAYSPADEWSVQALLDDETDAATLDATLGILQATPSLIGSLMATQFVKDAINGNPCPDRHYTMRIMQFIAAAEARRK